MIPIVVLQSIQVAVGVGLVVYAALLFAQRARAVHWHIPRWVASPNEPDADLRALVDMAARLRDAGNVEAVRACQALIDELLLPKTPEPTKTP